MDFVDGYLAGLEAAIHKLSRQEVSAVVEALLVAWRADRQIFIIGNGGSAATASHMMNDINKLTISPGKRRFRGIALTDNMPLITAWGNDADFVDVFAEPLRNLMRKGDVLVVISASGNSPNLVEAVRVARTECGAQIIGFTGDPGGKLAQQADLVVRVPSPELGHQEDGHLIINHVVCNALAERMRSE